jgi:hypothetical protein
MKNLKTIFLVSLTFVAVSSVIVAAIDAYVFEVRNKQLFVVSYERALDGSHTNAKIGKQPIFINSSGNLCVGGTETAPDMEMAYNAMDGTPVVRFRSSQTTGASVTAKQFITSTTSLYFFNAADIDEWGQPKVGAVGLHESRDIATGATIVEQVRAKAGGGYDRVKSLGSHKPSAAP